MGQFGVFAILLFSVLIATLVPVAIVVSHSRSPTSLNEVCLLDVAENANLCWNSTILDYCRYPLSVNLTGLEYYNFSQILSLVEETLGSQYELNLENGCFFTTVSRKRNTLDHIRVFYSLDRFIFVLSINSTTNVSIPLSNVVNYNETYTCNGTSEQEVTFEINWGDGSENDFVNDSISSLSHTYAEGNYTITIGGAIYSWSTFCSGEDIAPFLIDVIQYGDIFTHHVDFDGAISLSPNVSAPDAPNPLVFFSNPTQAPTQAPTEAPTACIPAFCAIEIGNGTNLCWNGSDYCIYPISIRVGGTPLYNLSAIVSEIQTVYGYPYVLDMATGCYCLSAKRGIPIPPFVPAFYSNDRFISVSTLVSPTTLTFPIVACNSSDALVSQLVYFDVDWGDGSPVENFANISLSSQITHAFAPGTYTVTVGGVIPSWDRYCEHVIFGNDTAGYMTEIIQFGHTVTQVFSLRGEFGLANISATDAPNPSLISTRSMFANCFSVNFNASHWYLPNLETAEYMFNNNNFMNPDIRNWNLINLKSARNMFAYSAAYTTVDNLNLPNLQHLDFFCFGCVYSGDYYFANATFPELLTAAALFCFVQSNLVDMNNLYAPKLQTLQETFLIAQITTLNMLNWTVPLLTNIVGLFQQATIGIANGLDTFDVSNFTTLSLTFASASFGTPPNLDNWSTPALTYVAYTFDSANIDIDFTNWNFTQVDHFDNFITFLSETNYNILLIKLDNEVPVFVTPKILAVNQFYNTSIAGAAHASLLGKGWNLTDLGGN